MDLEKKLNNIDSSELETLNKNAEILYNFVSLYDGYEKEPRDYGTGELINMVEVHTLTIIEENPGITNNEVAKMWSRTKGAASQTVKKLEERGHIYREKCSDDKRTVHLYVTESGKILSEAHKKYDNLELIWAQEKLLEKFSKKEIQKFYEIIEYYTKLLDASDEKK